MGTWYFKKEETYGVTLTRAYAFTPGGYLPDVYLETELEDIPHTVIPFDKRPVPGWRKHILEHTVLEKYHNKAVYFIPYPADYFDSDAFNTVKGFSIAEDFPAKMNVKPNEDFTLTIKTNGFGLDHMGDYGSWALYKNGVMLHHDKENRPDNVQHTEKAGVEFTFKLQPGEEAFFQFEMGQRGYGTGGVGILSEVCHVVASQS